MNVTIKKSKAKGCVSAPPSKSISHRYIICGALSSGKSIISNLSYSEDISATIDCIKACGAQAKVNGSTVSIEGISKERLPETINFMCRESGSTMRFFMGVAMMFGCDSYFYGSETLRNRPMGIYEDICREQGILFEKEPDRIHVCGKLKAGDFDIKGNVSSQFITGLLFTLPMLEGDSVINLIPPVESRSYINLTLQALKHFGVTVKWQDENTLVIPGNQTYNPMDITVEGDYSNAAFLDGFNTIGGEVTVKGLEKDSLQGDRVYKELYPKLMAGKAEIDISDCPDLGPVLFALAAANHGGVFTGTKRLKIKESDRGAVMCTELAKFGIESVYEDNRIEIKASKLKAPVEPVSGANDHRIVMAFSLLLSLVGGGIEGAQAVRKSFPDFFERISELGIEVEKDGMD